MTDSTLVATDYDAYHQHGRTAILGDVFERVRDRTLRDVIRANRMRLAAGATLLDVGAGEGRYLPLWMQLFPDARIVSYELSPLASGRSALRFPSVAHVIGDAEDMKFADASADAIVTVETIEHVPHGWAMLTEMHRVLKPLGWALVSTPCGNRGSLEWWRARLHGELRPGVDDGNHFGVYDDPTHLRRYRSSEFREIAARAGFIVNGIWFNGHGFLWVGEHTEMRIKGRVDISRRSATASRIFERACTEIGALDWRLFRRLGFGSTMIALMRRSD